MTPTEREKGLMLVAIVDCMAGLTGMRPPAEREQIPQEMRPHIDRLMFEMWRIAREAPPAGLTAIKEAVSVLGASIAGTNPPGDAWVSVRARLDELRKLLDAAVPEALQKAEYGWLIENGQQGDELRYRNMEQGVPTWTADDNEALRFARRVDAEKFAAEDEDAWSIVEHGWGPTVCTYPKCGGGGAGTPCRPDCVQTPRSPLARIGVPPETLICPDCGHGNRLDGRIVHGSGCPRSAI